jgi:hypothetical protein
MALKFGDEPQNWTDLVDFATDLGYADWRDEILSFLLYPAEPRPEPATFIPLREAV